MAESRSLLAELARERMEREAKRRKTDESTKGTPDKNRVTENGCSGQSSTVTRCQEECVQCEDGDKSAAPVPSKIPSPAENVVVLPAEEVVVLSDDDDADGSSKHDEKGAKSEDPMWTLKILTYNLWFEVSVQLFERMAAIGSIIETEDPDVIMLQEVVPEMEVIFKASAWSKKYNLSRRPHGISYYTLLCVRKSLELLSPSDRHEFSNSQMGRDVLSVCLKVRGKHIVLATSHLESLTEYKAGQAKDAQLAVRKQQLEEAQKLLEVLANRVKSATGAEAQIIYAGDMNWDDKQTGKPALREGWADPWLQLHPRDPGYTYDGPRNSMLVSKFRNRLDRFFCRLRGVRAVGMRMVGLDPIPGVQYQRSVHGKMTTLPVAPSDHFGLVATFQDEESCPPEPKSQEQSSSGTGQAGIKSFFKRRDT